jgi:GNAT superfamily N-acetyltransferase
LDPQTVKYVKRSQRENLRRIRKNNLHFQISQDISDVKEFYYQHYIPHSRKRFADSAALVNIHRLEYYLRRGALIFWIMQAGHRLAGGLVIPDGTVLRLAVQGIADGRDDYLRQGASSALYHFVIEWAAEQGFSYLDLGLASPSLSDRILATKKRWGARLEPKASDRYSYAIHWRTCDHNVLRLLHREQLIFRDGAHLSAMTALTPDQPHDHSAIEELARRCWMPGLHRLIVVADDPQNVVASHGARTNDAALWITKPGPVAACLSQAVPLNFMPPRSVGRTIAEGARPATVKATAQRSNLPDCQTS